MTAEYERIAGSESEAVDAGFGGPAPNERLFSASAAALYGNRSSDQFLEPSAIAIDHDHRSGATIYVCDVAKYCILAVASASASASASQK